ncbi:hypothetical protein [Lactococcus taiwanensis]|uniref:hypothetical protein n=1 Tax=Lactococcus taiwanensis TaxID=1151742 RepID=UPI00351704A1
MQLNIHDLTLKRVGVINNHLPKALHYFDDNWHRYLSEGTSTFDFSVNKSHTDCALLTMQGYISFTYDDEEYLFKIVNLRQDHYSMQVQCENLNFELIKEEVGICKNTKRHSIVWYLKNAAKITDNILEIGNNSFSEIDEDKNNPVLNFDNTETKLARILSICNSFKAEFQFRTVLKNDGTLQNITLDLYKKDGVGQKRKDVILYYGKNIDGITSTGDFTSTFFNATTVTDSNNKYNWKAIEGRHYNSEGQLEFYKNAGENTAYAPLSRDMFPSQIKSKSADRYTRKNLSIEATSADSLWDYAVSQFKLYAYPQMTYEVSVAVNAVTNALGNERKLDIGDTITIQDKTFDQSDGGLILSARVTEQEISFTNSLNNKITFSNFVQLKSEISEDLLSRVAEIAKENAPYQAEIETSNGVQFKNGNGSTTLSAHIYQGAELKEIIADVYEWTRNGVLIANAQEIMVDASGFSDRVVYAYQAKLNDKVIASASVTLTNVVDGTEGKPGKNGRSVVSIEQKYQVTQTDAKPTESWEDEHWQIVEPKMTASDKYLWSITRLTFDQAPLTQDKVEKKAVYGDTGKSGADGDPGKIVSETEPTTKFKGLTWKYSGLSAIDASDGTNIQPNTEYYWNGKNWVLNQINAQNIITETLTALGDVIAGSFTLAKGKMGGVSVKDGVVKTWDVSKVSDPNYPDGNSYTSMGVALDSGGVTFYSSDYGTVIDDEGVIDKKYKVANLRAIAHNSRQDGNVGLVLDVTDPDFPLTINGNMGITGNLKLSTTIGTLKSDNMTGISIYKNGNHVAIRLVGVLSNAVSNGNLIGSIPEDYRPDIDWHFYCFGAGKQYRVMIRPDGGLQAAQDIPANVAFRDTLNYII